jgi:hypothetical protein
MCIKDEEEEKPLIFVSADIVIAVDRRGLRTVPICLPPRK